MAITDNSVVKIGDYHVADGKMAFSVSVDDIRVEKNAVKDLVEVKAKMSDVWSKPSSADIDFEDGKVIVTPNKDGRSGFGRVIILEGNK